MIKRLESLLQQSIDDQASDIHVVTNLPPFFRRHGDLFNPQPEPWQVAEMNQLLEELLSPQQKDYLQESRSLDLAYSLPNGTRFRFNLFHQKNLPSLAARRLNDEIQDYASLNLPPELDRIPELSDGLVLITGPTGSGKSTTLAATIDRINQASSAHIITIEDPIEQIHQSKKSLIQQRELYRDVPSFFQGVKDALREDPDIILVGEMRDSETMKTAITAAETGHLVFSTLHTGDAVGAVNRILGGFSAEEQRTLRHQLSMVLRCVVSQHLVPDVSRTRRIPIIEVLWATKPVTNHIRSGRVEQIYSIMESGSQHGMLTREHSLANHVHSGLVKLDEALKLAREKQSLIDLLELEQSGANTAKANT